MRQSESGFTLIEVLVAIAVIALAFAGIAAMGVTTLGADTQSRQISAATALAQAKLEELRIVRRTHADWADGSHSSPDSLQEDGTPGGPYTREWEVELNYNGFTHLSRVTITVSWDNSEVSLASLYW
jgi:prepilin-type N-terminal cleavage/methylation domain-containing protein